MKIQVLIIIIETLAIIAALAVYLIMTIVQLFKINAGLNTVLGSVGEIVAKSAPVNGVLDAINGNLVTARDALENLHLKKGGPDAAGLVESLFPGEGAKFLQRVGRSGKVVNVGSVYTRGVGILASLGRGAPIGAAHAKGAAIRNPLYQTSEVAKLYPAPITRRAETSKRIPNSPVIGKDPVHSPYEPVLTEGTRPRDASGAKIEAPPAPAGGIQPGGKAPSGKIDVGKAPAPDAPPSPGRMSVKGSRPWER